jgi:hypothetical protein
MPETYKESQVESLFEPKTEDDKLIVHLLKAADMIHIAHPGDERFVSMHGALLGMAQAIVHNTNLSSFDPAFVDETASNLTISYFDQFTPEQGNEG